MLAEIHLAHKAQNAQTLLNFYYRTTDTAVWDKYFLLHLTSKRETPALFPKDLSIYKKKFFCATSQPKSQLDL